MAAADERATTKPLGGPRSRRRRLAARVALGLAAACSIGAPALARAEPSPAWVASSSLSPVEQRVAVASGPARTTVWTSLRFTAPAGPVAVVVPVSDGAALDLSSDAWMEALEAATAPRVLPPSGVSSTCPGTSDDGAKFHVEGTLDHEVTLDPEEITLLDDASAVSSWASAHGLALSDTTAAALAAQQGERFLALRFTAPGGSAVTRTVRVATSGAPAALPLALVRAGAADLRVTAFVIGEGRASLGGTSPITLDPIAIHWNASTGGTTYGDARHDALAAALGDGVLVEAASHASLFAEQSFTDGAASVDAVVTSYFERAAAYGDAEGDPSTCASKAAAALSSSATVAASCARDDLSPAADAGTCAESPEPGQVDPAMLRCGAGADDLAVALSGMTPSSTWLTRASLLVPAGQGGASRALAFGDGAPVSPVVQAGVVDLSGCGQDGGSGSSATGNSSGSGQPGTSGGAVGVGVGVGSGTGGYGPGSGYGASDSYDVAPPATVDLGCDCSGTTESAPPSDTGSDGCGSDTSDTSSDGCASDTSDTSSDGCSSDTSGGSGSDGCSSDSSGSSDGCSGDGSSGGDSCSGGSGDDDCSVGQAGRRVRPRLSALAFGLLFVIAPLRRRGRRVRRRR